MSVDSFPTRPLTSRARRAILLSDEAAAGMQQTSIGTEHLLLGLLADAKAPAAQILMQLGVDAEKVRLLLARAGA